MSGNVWAMQKLWLVCKEACLRNGLCWISSLALSSNVDDDDPSISRLSIALYFFLMAQKVSRSNFHHHQKKKRNKNSWERFSHRIACWIRRRSAVYNVRRMEGSSSIHAAWYQSLIWTTSAHYVITAAAANPKTAVSFSYTMKINAVPSSG